MKLFPVFFAMMLLTSCSAQQTLRVSFIVAAVLVISAACMLFHILIESRKAIKKESNWPKGFTTNHPNNTYAKETT
jgi:hypothetical protein